MTSTDSQDRVFVLERLTDEDISRIIMQALERVTTTDPLPQLQTGQSDASSSHPDANSSSLQNTLSVSISQSSSTSQEALPFPALPQLTSKIISSIVTLSSGDARTALSLIELALSSSATIPAETLLSSLRQSVSTSYDRTGESHYDMISALHKSVRGSQGSAALYWLARMLTAGEDPLYIARRMVVCASEDIGLADNHALPLVCFVYVHLYFPLIYRSVPRRLRLFRRVRP